MFPIRDNIPSRRVPVVMYALLALNALMFLHQVLLPPREAMRQVTMLGVVPARLLHRGWAAQAGFPPGASVTLLTSMFLHGGWFHLVSNLWALWLFGDNVEDRLGHVRFLLFYLVSGVCAMLLHAVLNAGSTVPAIGASGAIAGVMGAYLLYYPLARMVVMVPIFFYPMLFEVPAVVFLLIWIASQVSGGTSALLFGMRGVGGVAFWAHVGGFFTGLFLATRWGLGFRHRRAYGAG